MYLHISWISFQLVNINVAQTKLHAQRLCSFAKVFDYSLYGDKLSELFKQNHVSKT